MRVPKPAKPKSTVFTTSSDSSISVRFGDAMLEAGHTAIPNLALNHYSQLGLSPADAMFIFHAWQFWWTERNPYPSLGSIARRMGVSRRQVRTYVSRLKAAGYLIVRERTLPGLGQVSSEYDFAPFLKAIVEAANEGEPGDGTPPGKDSSYPPRKSASHEEDKEQEDKALASKCARVKGEENPGPEGGTTPVGAISDPRRSGLASIAEVLAARKMAVLRRAPQKDPNRKDPLSRGGSESPTVFLDSAVSEVVQELGDGHNFRSDLAHARNLFRQSGLLESSFVERVFRARALVRSRQRERGPGIRKGGAYFFAVLRDLLPQPHPTSALATATLTPREDGQQCIVPRPHRVDAHPRPERANLHDSRGVERPSGDE